jgi:cell division protein FtsI/penicillin-binding protein 2
LTRALRGSADPSTTLTIDPVAQKTVRDVLEERRRRCGGGGGDCVFTHRGVRASIVLIDASDDRAGEIRAMLAWPPGEVGSHVWDLAAGGGGAWRSTATSRQAWSVGFDGHSQPGSTFKPVTALAAIEASLDPENPASKDLSRLLRGEMSLAEQARYLGFRTRVPVTAAQRRRDCRAVGQADPSSANVLFVPNRGGGSFSCLQNFGDAANNTYFMSTSVSRCPGGGRGGTQLGLCEALIKSSNLFFGGISLLLDGPKIYTAGSGEHPPAADALAIGRMANRLVPPQSDANKFNDLMRGSLPRRASLLFYDPRPVTLDNARPDPTSPTAPKLDRRVMAATTGYGQNVYAAPLVMASIYASIAANHVVRPRLVPLESLPANRPRDPLEGAPLLTKGTPAQQASYLAILRAGLHGVVTARGGSAASHFRNNQSLTRIGDQPRLFGKTGTATISGRLNTVWFAGWIEGNQGSGITKRLAFVCQAIQQPAGQKMTGGRICAPLIRDILLRLDQKRS